MMLAYAVFSVLCFVAGAFSMLLVLRYLSGEKVSEIAKLPVFQRQNKPPSGSGPLKQRTATQVQEEKEAGFLDKFRSLTQ